MLLIHGVLDRIRRVLLGRKYTSRKEGADTIRKFVHGTSSDYEWDDFESIEEDNPEVDLAIRLCWFVATKFPARRKTEYCAPEALPYFLRIADALENGFFAKIDYEQAKVGLQRGVLTDYLNGVVDLDS